MPYVCVCVCVALALLKSRAFVVVRLTLGSAVNGECTHSSWIVPCGGDNRIRALDRIVRVRVRVYIVGIVFVRARQVREWFSCGDGITFSTVSNNPECMNSYVQIDARMCTFG